MAVVAPASLVWAIAAPLPPPAATHEGPTALPAPGPAAAGDLPAGLAPVIAAALAPPDCTWRPTSDGFAAANPAQDLAVGFTRAGALRVTAGGAGRTAGPVRESAFGRQGTGYEAPPQPDLVANGARVEYRRGPVTEWYVNDGRGLEQGFTLDARPAGTGPRQWSWRCLPAGLRPVLDPGDSLSLRRRRNHLALRRSPRLRRPRPRRAPRLGVAGAKVTLTVDDAGAAYPLTIDPIIATQEAHLSPSDPAFDQFGPRWRSRAIPPW